MPTGQNVADFLGQGSDTTLVALAGKIVPVITSMVAAYTRGRGLTTTSPTTSWPR